jgi:hypothetical protein
MSPEAKEAQREKSKFAMQKRHRLETKEQTALAKDKHRDKQRLSKTRKCQAETEEETKLHRENDIFKKNRKWQTEIDEETKSHRENVRLMMKRNHQDETEEQPKLRRKSNRLNMKRKREAKIEEQTKLQRENNNMLAMRKKRQAKTEEKTANCHAETEEHKDDMANVINWSKKEAIKLLHRIIDLKNPHKHRAIVCIICNCCIIGTETICKLTKEQILLHKKRLSVDSHEEYYETTLKPEVTKQYQINVDDLKGMFLSPQSRK